MPNKKISELAEKFALSGLDLIPIVDQSTGITKKITGDTLVRYANTDLRKFSPAWDSTYSSVAGTSADWNYSYQEVTLNSPVWNSAPSLFLALSGGKVTGETRFDENVTIFGNLTALGTTTFANSYVSTTSALSVVNVGAGEALNVYNLGTGAIARFIDASTFQEVFHIGGVSGFAPNVGVFTDIPGKHFTVAGEISATQDISTGGRFVGDGSSLTSISANNITSGVLSNTIMPASATFASSVSSGVYYGDGSNLTGVAKNEFVLSAASANNLGGVRVDNTTIQIDGSGLISYNLPADATFTSSVSAPALRGMFYGDGSGLTNLPLYFLSAASVNGLGGIKVDGTNFSLNQSGSLIYTPPANATFTSSLSAPTLSGVHFGDGSNLTGVVKTPYTPPANATFTSSVSAPALSGIHFGDGSNLTGVVKTQYSLPIASTSNLGGVRVDGTTINITSNGTIRVVGGVGGGSGSAALSASTTITGGIKLDGSTASVDSTGTFKLIESGIGVNDALSKTRLWERVDTFYSQSQAWADIAVSLDGEYLVAAPQSGLLHIFKNNEFAYTAPTGTKNWGKVAISFNGQYIVATESEGLIWESTNYGVTFDSKATTKSWTGIAVSPSGQYQTALVFAEQMYKSSDYGDTWSVAGDSRAWNDVAISNDGRYQIACAAGEGVYLSTNYGISFNLISGLDSRLWNSVAMSFDGRIQFAVEATNFYKSTNFGSSFTTSSTPVTFLKIECSSSGKEILGLAANGVVYTSSNQGATWRQRVVSNGTSGGITVAGNGTNQFVSVNGVIYKGNTTNYYFDKALSATSFFGDGRNLTNLNIEVPKATSLVVGGVRLDGIVFSADNTGLLNFAFPANATITSSLSAPALSGILYGDGFFITNLNASNISNGTLNNSRLPSDISIGNGTFSTSVSSAALSGSFYGDGRLITELNASAVSSGTLSNDRLPSSISLATGAFSASVSSAALSGSFYGDGRLITELNATAVTHGTLSNDRLPSSISVATGTFSTSVSSAALSGSFYGDGRLLTELNASAVSSGTLNNDRLPSSISVATGTFSTSVSSAALSGSFYGDGRLLTELNASAVTHGTLNNDRLPTNISFATGTFSTSVSAPALSGMFYGDGTNITGVAASGGFATDLTKLPLSGGLILGDLTITGNLSTAGPVTFVGNTVFASTSSLSVVNISPTDIPALFVGQSGPGDIATFYDIDAGIEVLHIGGHNGSHPNIGIKTSVPNKTLTVSGEISATSDIHSGGKYYGDGSELLGVIKTQYVPPADATFTSSVSAPALSGVFHGDGSNLTGVIKTQYVPPADATFTASVSAPALSGSFYGDGSNLFGVIKTQYTPPADATFTSSVSAPALSGTFHGDGSNLTGVVKTQYTPPADATFTSSVSAPALSGSFYGDGSNLFGVIKTQYTPPADATFTSSVSAPALSGSFYGDGSNLFGVIKTQYTPPADATFTSSVSAPAVSGIHFGDGSNLTGVVKTQYTPPSDATFTSSVSAPALSGVHFGDGSNLTGVVKTQYTPPADATFTSSVSAPALSGVFYGDGSNLTGINSGVGGLYLPLSGGAVSGPIYFNANLNEYGARIDQGRLDTSRGGLSGISLVCSVDYDFNWQAGWITAFEQDRITPRPLYVDSGAGSSIRSWSNSGSGVEITHEGIVFPNGSVQNVAAAVINPIDATFTSSVSAPVLNGSFVGDGSGILNLQSHNVTTAVVPFSSYFSYSIMGVQPLNLDNTHTNRIVKINTFEGQLSAVIPHNDVVPMQIGTQIVLIKDSDDANSIVVVPDIYTPGVTLISKSGYRSITTQAAIATLIKLDTNEWILAGGIAN